MADAAGTAFYFAQPPGSGSSAIVDAGATLVTDPNPAVL